MTTHWFGSLVVLPLRCLFKLQFVAVCSLWMQLCVKSFLGKWSHFRKMLISRSVSAAPLYQPSFSGRGRLSTLQTLLLMKYLFWTHRVLLWLLSLHLKCRCDRSGKDRTLHVFFSNGSPQAEKCNTTGICVHAHNNTTHLNWCIALVWAAAWNIKSVSMHRIM